MNTTVKRGTVTRETQTLRERLLQYKIRFLGGILFLIGLLLLVSAILMHERPVAEYLKDSGFHVGTAGLVLMLVDWLLRKESNDFIRQSLREIVSDLLDETHSGHFTRLEERVPTAIKEEISRVLINDIVYIREAVAKNAVQEVLTARMKSGSDGAGHLARDLSILVENLDLLMSRTDWARDIYVTYLSEVVQSAGENAKEFCELTSDSMSAAYPRPIKLASPAERTDKILASLMRLLPSESTYDVISDIESWKDKKLDDFEKASRDAVQSGVTIRRIFVISNNDLRDGSVTPADAHQIIQDHLTSAGKSHNGGSYHVRLIDTTLKVPSGAGELVKMHFGIFSPHGEPQSLQVRVDRRDFGKLSLASLPRNSDDATHFNRVWTNVLKDDLDPVVLTAAVERWEKIACEGREQAMS